MKIRSFLMVLAFVLLIPTVSCSQVADITGIGANKVMMEGSGAIPPTVNDEPAPAPMAELSAPSVTEQAASTPQVINVTMERKVVYNATVSVEVKKCDKAITDIEALAKASQGYVLSTNSYELGDGREESTVVIKVPADKFETAIAALEKLGHVKSEGKQGDDITEEYFDLQTTLANSKKFEARLQELLNDKNNKLSDMLDVEKELGRVRGEIDKLEGKKRYYDSQVSMSAITIYLSEPYKLTSSILDPIKDALKSVGLVFMRSIAALMLFVVGFVPWFVLILFFGYIIVKVVRRIRRKKKHNDDASA